MPNNQPMPKYRVAQFRLQEDYVNNSDPGFMPMIALMFNGDISSPAKFAPLSSDARKIANALIASADRMEARFVERCSDDFEQRRGTKDGIQPTEEELD